MLLYSENKPFIDQIHIKMHSTVKMFTYMYREYLMGILEFSIYPLPGSLTFLLQKDSMERLVLAPLSSLQGMFTAPQKLIQKRYDKLLDYCSRLERSSSFSSSSTSSTTSSSPSPVLEDPPGPARRDYEALNALLVEELQRFNKAAYTVLTNCVVYLVALLRGLMDQILLRAPSIQQLPVRIPHIKNTDSFSVCLILTLKCVLFVFSGSIVKHC